jgi:CubicO group peptidase (beta-lactamase class C family)
MSGTASLSATLQTRLDELARKHNVVGASAAVQQGDDIAHAVTGLTNVRTGVPVRTDTVFQIGSISKVYTATLVMQLVDEGLVDIDRPIGDYLPGFALADPAAAAVITIRQLLSHTSGMDGDVFDEFGRGDDCVGKYVEAMSGLVQTSAPSAFFSYCNSGFVLLGHLVEQLRGLSWDAALRKHLLAPLGLVDTVTLADEAILRSAAVGHLATGEGGAAQVAPMWFFSRALGPAGVVTAPAHEVIAFARMHLADGRALDGTQVLSPSSVKLMRELQVRLPDPYTLGDGWGLGWILYTLGEPNVIGHDGATVGQQAYLRIVPDRDLVVVLLTNGGGMGALFGDLIRPLLTELAGATLNPDATLPPSPVDADASAFLGTFERSGIRIEITRDDAGTLFVQGITTGPLASAAPQEPPTAVVVLDENTLITAEPDKRLGRHVTFTFLEPTDDGFRYMHSGGRATPRVAS